MKGLFASLFDRSGFFELEKLKLVIDCEHAWGGYARPASDISDRGIKRFFESYGTTAVGYKKFDNPTFFAGYYFIPPEKGKNTAHEDSSDRIAVLQRVPIFLNKYRNIVLVKSFPGAENTGDDVLALMGKKMYFDDLIEKIRAEGGLTVHRNTREPI